jgi:hypothetical protein
VNKLCREQRSVSELYMGEKFLGLVELNEMFNNLKTMINIYFIIFMIRRMIFYLASIGKVIMNRFLTSHEFHSIVTSEIMPLEFTL